MPLAMPLRRLHMDFPLGRVGRDCEGGDKLRRTPARRSDAEHAAVSPATSRALGSVDLHAPPATTTTRRWRVPGGRWGSRRDKPLITEVIRRGPPADS